MLPGTLIKDFDAKRVKLLLALVFAALAVPTAVLIWQAYSQLKWEAFHQHRSMAEELTSRINTRLIERINTAEARSFTDYSFLVVTGDPATNFLQRSPLSAFPVTQDVPGVLGYFQVNSNGEFSTPLVPEDGAAPEELGIGAGEYDERLTLAREIQQILADNSLVSNGVTVGGRVTFRDRLAEVNAPAPMSPASQEERADDDRVAKEEDTFQVMAETKQQRSGSNSYYSQQAFDELSNAPVTAPFAAGATEAGALGDDREARQRANVYGKVADLKLDATLQKKSEDLQRGTGEEQERTLAEPSLNRALGRSRRVEQAALPARDAPTEAEEIADIPATERLRISTFESEIDPYEFSLLDSGHFVLFRKVWRDGERYIQGLLIDQRVFLSDVIEASFRETALAAMSNLIVGYRGDVIELISGGQMRSYPISAGEMEGDLLYRTRLSAPLHSLELIFSINRLPAGPGASVLTWTTIIIALVFLGGFYALYRLAVGQLHLARQQQDFVSAVSHELKTPLTSIRMYGEMLKAGWVDEEKRKQYYEYIHDESERLTRLIANVLQLAKITHNEPQIDRRPKTVGELMAQTESKIANHVERAGFQLSLKRDQPTDEKVVNVDDDCFAQIIINLVDNAIKFSKGADDRRIQFASSSAGDNNVSFTVRDFGPGVPRNQMKKIFKLFYRSESELTRETVGTGIGLAIVHQLTLAMGGKVDVINREPGAEFRVSFPLAT